MHSCRLISAFFIHLLESITFKIATSEISIFLLVSVAEEAGLSLALSETLTTGFLTTRPIIMSETLMEVIVMSTGPCECHRMWRLIRNCAE